MPENRGKTVFFLLKSELFGKQTIEAHSLAHEGVCLWLLL